MPPRASVIVTCYNYGRFVAHAVDSLLGQTVEALEVIVIDDASSDDSADVLERYRGDPRVHLVLHARNTGHILAYNEGLKLAQGEFVGVLAADDFAVTPYAVERQLAVFDAHPQVGLVYSAHSLVDESEQQFRLNVPWEADYVREGLEEFASLIHLNYVPHSGTLVRRSCHAEVGDYDLRLPHSGDWDLWLRLACRYGVGYIAEPLYAYRVHRTNMSHASVSPRQATGELLLTVQKAFDALPAGAPAALRRLRPAAVRRALLMATWNDRSLGRARRSWAGLLDAARRSPGLLVAPAFYGALARLLVLTAVGHRRYERLAVWRSAQPGGRPHAAT